jgi:hypothetical protein
MPVLEIRSYVLKPDVRQHFHELFASKVMAQLADAGIRVVRYGPSLHDDRSYVLMRAFDSLEQLAEQEERFYGSPRWRDGYREDVLAMIESYQDVVLDLDNGAIDGLAV